MARAIVLLGVLVGVIAGPGAVFFRDLMGLIHNVALLGTFSIEYDANQFTPPRPWGTFIIVVPVLGSYIVTYLVEKYAPEARGYGVPEVQWHRHTADWQCLYRSLSQSEALNTIQSNGIVHPI